MSATIDGIPRPPDFAAIEAVAGTTAERRHEIFALMGNLSYSWSNNESMLIYVLMILLGTDAASAALVFGTLNTSRARTDLVKRLAKANIRDPATAGELSRLLRWLESGTKIRNDFNHSMFSLDERGDIVETHAMRIEEKNGQVSFGAGRAMDERRMATIRTAVVSMAGLNKELWSFLPRLKAGVRSRDGES